MIKNKALAFLAIILLLPILACKIQATERTPPATVLPGMPGVPPQPPSITTAVIATPTQPIHAEKVNIVSTWFYQDKDFKSKVYFAFVVENPNPNLALANMQFQAVAYDASETILGTGTVDIGVLFPGERRAISSSNWLEVPESSTVTRISVEIIRSAEAQISKQRGSPFTTEKVTYFSGYAYSRITGVIRNTLNADISNIFVTAIAYDESGNIIGAGTDLLESYLPADGSRPVIIRIQIVGEPAKVELYPFLYEIEDIDKLSQSIEALRIVAVGANQDQYNQAYLGMIVENTDTKARDHSLCTLIAYDENGTVLEITRIVVPLIFPGERLGVSGFVSLPEQTKLGKVEAQVLSSGSADESDFWGIQKAGITGNPLTAKGASYPSDNYDGLITGIVKNSYGKDLQDIQVTAIAYDASGAIIGGWSTTVSSVLANGQIAISIWTNLKSPPAVIELYPTLILTSPLQ